MFTHEYAARQKEGIGKSLAGDFKFRMENNQLDHIKSHFEQLIEEKNTPKTADNFIRYIEEGFYDGTIFHRVIKSFMIQGGGFKPGLSQKAAHRPIENEADKAEKNKRGTIAMARTSDPHSATAQYFINLVDNDFLDHSAKSIDGWGYCVFGRVTDGMDVVDKIAKVKTASKGGYSDVPAEDVIIEKVTIQD